VRAGRGSGGRFGGVCHTASLSGSQGALGQAHSSRCMPAPQALGAPLSSANLGEVGAVDGDVLHRLAGDQPPGGHQPQRLLQHRLCASRARRAWVEVRISSGRWRGPALSQAVLGGNGVRPESLASQTHLGVWEGGQVVRREGLAPAKRVHLRRELGCRLGVGGQEEQRRRQREAGGVVACAAAAAGGGTGGLGRGGGGRSGGVGWPDVIEALLLLPVSVLSPRHATLHLAPSCTAPCPPRRPLAHPPPGCCAPGSRCGGS
jgi:hypothetical protein